MRLIVQPGRDSTLNGFNEIPPLLDIASQTILQSEGDLSSQLNVARKMRSRDLPETRLAGAQLNPNATIYDGALVEGVKHYYDRHGETPTGELNTPPAVGSRQFKVTLERWRWLPQSLQVGCADEATVIGSRGSEIDVRFLDEPTLHLGGLHRPEI